MRPQAFASLIGSLLPLVAFELHPVGSQITSQAQLRSHPSIATQNLSVKNVAMKSLELFHRGSGRREDDAKVGISSIKLA